MCWINSPYKCRKWNNIMNFRYSLMLELEEGEIFEADDGCVGGVPQNIRLLMRFAEDDDGKLMQSSVRNRKKTVNNRSKYWIILKYMYRYDVSKHGSVFQSIVIFIPLTLNCR